MKKISKDEWLKLTIDEKEHLQLEFSKSQANKKYFYVISSRVLALFLILAIVWVGFVQIAYVQDIREIQGKYGTDAWCYLCGKESLKECECTYLTTYEMRNINLTQKRLELAEHNIQECLITKLETERTVDLLELNRTIQNFDINLS